MRPSLKRVEADLMATRSLQKVRRNPAATAAWVNDAVRHVSSAKALARTDPRLAYAACHDAIRKALTGLLADRGFRPSGGEGSHLRVQEWGELALAGTVDDDTLAAMDLVRRQRHEAEYGELASQAIGPSEVAEAARVAEVIVAGVKAKLRTGSVI